MATKPSLSSLTPEEQKYLRNQMLNQGIITVPTAPIPPEDEIPDQMEFIPPKELLRRIQELTSRVELLETELRHTYRDSRTVQGLGHQVWNGIQIYSGSAGVFNSPTSAIQQSSNISPNVSSAKLQYIVKSEESKKNKKKKYGLF